MKRALAGAGRLDAAQRRRPPVGPQVLDAVGMGDADLAVAPASLSDGYKRRLALAVQVPSG